jgi:serine protease Do
MRTWTLVAAGLFAATAAATAAVLPDTASTIGPQQEEQKRPSANGPGEEDGIVREVQRSVQMFGGRDVQIGVTIRDLEGDQARTKTGAVVSDVREDSPAAKAGIKDGDLIVEFDGERVRSARHLSRVVGETAAGRPVRVVVEREGRRMDLQVTPDAGSALSGGDFRFRRLPGREFEFNGPNFRFDGPEMRELLEEHGHGDAGAPDVMMRHGRGRLGIGIEDLSPQLAEYFGTKDGVLVTSVEPESPAAKAGLKAGDVITAVGETTVSTPSDLTRAVRRAGEGAELSITYTRDKKSGTAKAKIEARPRAPERRKGEPI